MTNHLNIAPASCENNQLAKALGVDRFCPWKFFRIFFFGNETDCLIFFGFVWDRFSLFSQFLTFSPSLWAWTHVRVCRFSVVFKMKCLKKLSQISIFNWNDLWKNWAKLLNWVWTLPLLFVYSEISYINCVSFLILPLLSILTAKTWKYFVRRNIHYSVWADLTQKRRCKILEWLSMVDKCLWSGI